MKYFSAALWLVLGLCIFNNLSSAYPQGRNGSVINDGDVTVYVLFRSDYGTTEVSLPARSSTDISDDALSLRCMRRSRIHISDELPEDTPLHVVVYRSDGSKIKVTEWGKTVELQPTD